MKHIDYVDLPNPPENLILPLEDIIKIDHIPEYSNPVFKSLPLNSELSEWFRDNIKFETESVRYQVIDRFLPPHKDWGNRIFCFNYNLSPGGDRIRTLVYDEDMTTPLDSLVIESRRWHFLTTGYYHGIVGRIFNRINISITPTFAEQEKFLKVYTIR